MDISSDTCEIDVFNNEILKNEFVSAGDKSLAYYTSLDVVKKIICSNEFWLTNCSAMNDMTEILYGRKILLECLWKDVFNPIIDVLCNQYKDYDVKYWKAFLHNVITSQGCEGLFHKYVCCFTEHTEDEKQYGRLSMWRAYGRGAGAAMVFNSQIIRSVEEKSSSLKFIKVQYLNQEEVANCIHTLAEDLDKVEFGSLEHTQNVISRTISTMLISLKHPGFREEKEWRLVYSEYGGLDFEKFKVESVAVNSFLRPIVRLNMDELVHENLQYILIGPSQYFTSSATALKYDLKSAVYHNCEELVKCSEIPLRPGCI